MTTIFTQQKVVIPDYDHDAIALSVIIVFEGIRLSRKEIFQKLTCGSESGSMTEWIR